MNIFYEEDGGFKVGNILTDNITSLQVENTHGKRSKIKSANVMLRFAQPGLSEFLAQAEQVATGIDVDFLWEASPPEEFSFDVLAQEYFGHVPNPVEAAGALIRLHGSPMHFYKKGKGRYKAAPPDALKSALASVEKKRLQAELQASYTEQLSSFHLPEEFAEHLAMVLYKPDRNTIEVKALEAACAATHMSAAHLLHRCGALPSTHDYHLNKFLFENFPRGRDFPALTNLNGNVPKLVEGDAVQGARSTETGMYTSVHEDFEHRATLQCAASTSFGAFPELPLATVNAFSIDDASTTEIDDAFSLEKLANGHWRIGVHIAAPTLGIAPNSPIDVIAAQRLSTVYMPGDKITMLPDNVVQAFTLCADKVCPALSLYVEADAASLAVLSSETRVERLHIAANLRHDTLEPLFNEETLAAGKLDYPYAPELKLLWEFAQKLEAARGKSADNSTQQIDYTFHVENDRVTIGQRLRGSPIDKVVSELMILANSMWGKLLDDHDVAGIYRTQNNGKVKMSTIAAPHQGLGVAHYAWSSSPLRRYVDMVNQRQLISVLRGEPPAYARNDTVLFSILSSFDTAYTTYNEFQRNMERYWCLRWLQQEQKKLEALTPTLSRVAGTPHPNPLPEGEGSIALSPSGGKLDRGLGANEPLRGLVVPATVLRENLVKLTDIPLVGRIPSLPELPPNTKVTLALGEIDLLDLEFDARYQANVEVPA